MADGEERNSTVDLTVAPTEGVGRGTWLVLAVVIVAAVATWVVFVRDPAEAANAGLDPAPGSRVETMRISGRDVTIRLGAPWRRQDGDDPAHFELPIAGWDEVVLRLHGESRSSARDCASDHIAKTMGDLPPGAEVLFDRFRWLDRSDGIGLHEVVIGESAARIGESTIPERHAFWIEGSGAVIGGAYDLLPGVPEAIRDQVERAISTIRVR